MTTPVFAELDQLQDAMAQLVGEARGLANSAEALPGKIAAVTALARRALHQTESVVTHAASEAAVKRIRTYRTEASLEICRLVSGAL